MDLYIYYRVSTDNAASLQQQLRAMQSALSTQWHVEADIKRRPELQDQLQTWMEIYRQVPEGFLPALHRAVTLAGIEALIDGPRHLETFVDLDACV